MPLAERITAKAAGPRMKPQKVRMAAPAEASPTSPAGAHAYQGDGLLWSDVGGGANDFVLAALNDRAAFFTSSGLPGTGAYS